MTSITLHETLTDRLWKEAYRYMGCSVGRLFKEAARDREAQSELYGAACQALSFINSLEYETAEGLDARDALLSAIAKARGETSAKEAA